MKKVLITGANSYIGEAVKDYLLNSNGQYEVHVKDTYNWIPNKNDFSGFDVVFNVAGIAHIKETKKNCNLYYDINRDLVIEIASKAKAAGVKQFIALSSMSVYGLNVGYISKDTPVRPANAYGKSKAEADQAIQKLADENFIFVCLRPPMVYGKSCKGNYQRLRKIAIKSPVFPNYRNQRSMIYIGNLCYFVKKCIDDEYNGLYFPQNSEYVDSSEMVKLISEINGNHLKMTDFFNSFIKHSNLVIIQKVFGNLVYDKVDLVDKYSFKESMFRTES